MPEKIDTTNSEGLDQEIRMWRESFHESHPAIIRIMDERLESTKFTYEQWTNFLETNKGANLDSISRQLELENSIYVPNDVLSFFLETIFLFRYARKR